MALSKEWRRRIENWIAELGRQCLVPMGKIELEGFVTRERLKASDVAASSCFAPMPEGTQWGAKWEYGWFRGSLVLPPEARGKRIVLRLAPGPEGLVLLNGVEAGAVDREHREITLARPARGGESFDILGEFYAGHGAIEEDCGPVPPGRVVQPEPGQAQRRVGESVWGEWDDEAFMLLVDAETLYQTRCVLPESSLRVSEIDEALRAFATIVDFELPRDAMRATFRVARASLAPLLARPNGPTTPVMRIFGNSHLDLAWKWPVEETVRKSARTLSTQLALMDEYPEYRFLWCQVPLFESIRDNYPGLWSRLKARVAEGRIKVEGGMWLEPDTNLPSGEALVRQVALAKEFHQTEFGVDTRVLWLPDTFGFSAALPAIMAGTGLDYFATKKLVDNYNDSDPFPLVTFEWVGHDGSAVLSHVYRKCNSPIDPATFARRWNQDRLQRDGVSDYLFPFGYGDGGGGPTRTHLEFARRLGDLEGNPRAVWSDPRDFFEGVAAGRAAGSRPALPRYRGELYFAEHRGTYTSQARTKRAGRKAEIALREAEFWASAAGLEAGSPWPRGRLRTAWKDLLSNHFHDVITGASIARVHEEAVAQLDRAAAEAKDMARLAAEAIRAALGDTVEGITVFNSLSWERDALVWLPGADRGLVDRSGLPVPVQPAEGGCWAALRLPAAGWAGFPADKARVAAGAPSNEAATLRRDGDRFVLENDRLRVEVDAKGRLPSVLDKESGLELAAGPCNDFRMYRDVTTNYDAWDIDSMYRDCPVELGDGEASIEILARGPLFVSLALTRTLGASRLTQEIRLPAGAARLEFHTTMDWREDHKLLKVDFPTRLNAEDALYEIQFGHVRRPTHRNRRHDADRYEGCHHRWVALAESGRGLALLNDSKYGSSVEGGTINLSLLKAAMVPDPSADRGHHEFSYALMCWNGDFGSQGPVRAGHEFNIPPLVAQGAFAGRSLLGIDKPSVVLEALKLAEDGSGDLILRLYESSGSACRARVSLERGIAAAFSTDLLEGNARPCRIVEGEAELEFGAFGLRTLRLRPAG